MCLRPRNEGVFVWKCNKKKSVAKILQKNLATRKCKIAVFPSMYDKEVGEAAINKVKPVPSEMVEAYKKGLRKYGQKYEVLFMVGVSTGLRISDILPLRYGDFLPGKRVLRVKEQKTEKVRNVKVSKELRYYLLRNLDYYGFELDNYLVPGRQGKPLSRQQAYRTLRRAGEENGLECLGTHSMRKTYAVELYKSTGDVRKVQKELNHKYESTTIVNYILSGRKGGLI